MANINTYLEWRGDLRVGQKRPFNDVDAMILARFAYLPFDKVKHSRLETIGSICEKMSETLKIEDYHWPDDEQFVKNLAVSRRFKSMRISDYVKNNSKELERQFSAITVHISYNEMYLAFFGTDHSITGWKEDFNLAFLETIPAQDEGKKYLSRLRQKYPWKNIRLGGHSKGGNVAMYVAITAPDFWQRKMIKIYNFDGPGLRKGTAALDYGTERVIGKIHSFIPQGSVIGRLLEHTEKFTVVKSVEKNLYQHDLYSWQVTRNNVVKSTTTKTSDIADRTFTMWLENATLEEKKIFVDSMFKIFDSANVDTPMQLMDKWYKYAPTLIKAYREMPKERRAVIIDLWKRLGSSFMKARQEAEESEERGDAKS